MRILIALVFIITTFASWAEGTKINEPAPQFTALDSNGESITLQQFLGKKVVLEWTDPNCPFTGKHYKTGNMQALQEKYTKGGVIWLSIFSSVKGESGYLTGNEANSISEKRGTNATRILLDSDGSIGKLYSAKTTPHMFVIDEKGILRYKGAIDNHRMPLESTVAGAENYVAKALDELLAGEVVSEPITKSYGCSIKY